MSEVNGYILSKQWFAFAFENPDKVTPNHGALYAWLIELNNKMGWVTKFAAPASQSMAATGIKSYNTYKKAFDDLINFGFVKVIVASKNQYTSCIIALSKFDEALDKAEYSALDKALAEQGKSTEQSTCDIIKQINNKPIKQGNYKKEEDSAVALADSVKEISYPFLDQEFKIEWERWREYKKKEFRFTYKTVDSEQEALNKLNEFSHGKSETAVKILRESIANGWKGFFQLKKESLMPLSMQAGNQISTPINDRPNKSIRHKKPTAA